MKNKIVNQVLNFSSFFFQIKGGGKDLATAIVMANTPEDIKPKITPPSTSVNPVVTITPKLATGKLPGGLVTKSTTAGYEVIKPNISQSKLNLKINRFPLFLLKKKISRKKCLRRKK